MLASQLAGLLDGGPTGLDEALTVVAGFDDALTHGFARLTDEHTAALAALAGAVAGTPIGERVADAAGKLAAGSVASEHLVALAGARTALLGAVHDALTDRLDTALGRARAPWPAVDAPATARPAGDNLLAGARAWLHELAVTGWRGIDHDVVSGSAQTVEAILAEPALRRLAVLLDGLAAELRACCPVATMTDPPAHRWADLWARALLLSEPGAWADRPAGTVSGRLLILGVDVHEHATAFQAQVHAVLEPAGGQPSRLVRTSVAAAKVDTIVGPATWRLLGAYPVLLGALAGRRTLEVTDMPLLDSGDLVWHEDRAEAGAAADPFTTARVQLAGAPGAPVPPLYRHPVGIAEPVLLEGYTTGPHDDGGLGFDLGGVRVPVDLDRLPAGGPLTPALVAASSACLGLLRWDDGRWLVQPLAVRGSGRRATVDTHTGDWALGTTDARAAKAEARSGDVVAVLRERAGRLLRR
jgi:hypothetical protein